MTSRRGVDSIANRHGGNDMKNWTGVIRDLVWMAIIISGILITFAKLDARVNENREFIQRNIEDHVEFSKRFDVLTRMEERLIYMQRDIEDLKNGG